MREKEMLSGNSHFHLLFIGIVRILALEILSTSMGQGWEGCQETCGNLFIPYPFGTKEGCYHDPAFLITCNTTFSPPKPFLRKSRTRNLEVKSISLDDSELTILNKLAYDCYNQNGTKSSNFISFLELSSFEVSNRKNKFTVVGCDTYGDITGNQGEATYQTNCTARCDPTGTNIVKGSCTGAGCCQTSLTARVDSYTVSMSSYDNYTLVTNNSSCGYGFLVQESMYNFSMADLRGLSYVKALPIVLDWTIGNETCVATLNSKTNICGSNSECVDSYNRSGYRCTCRDGYRGNPYIHSGCHDIDECQDLSLNQCAKLCTNTVGNYTCSCGKGYQGDGRKDGFGCIPIGDHSFAIKIAVGVCIGLGALFLVIGGLWLSKLIKRRKEAKKNKKFFKRNGGLLLEQQISSDQGNLSKLFTSKELEKATENYNTNRILGQGGQGTVYKGMLSDGRIVAVKKAKIVDEGQVDQFINEVVILSQIQHRNIVKLHGCCLETEVPMLVYEYIPNGTLLAYIHEQIEEFPFTWELRLRIAAQVAEALSYLHSTASVPIYHRDIKSANILLDEKYKAKVSDFGISRSLSIDQTHWSTDVKGTFGYLDPEYYESSRFTEKSDVYSFGVVLVELLTGKKVISFTRSEECRGLASYFIMKMEENQLFDILDPRVAKEGEEKEIFVVANLALRCLNRNGRPRPTMRDVLVKLENIILPKTVLSIPQNDHGNEYPSESYGELETETTSFRSF